jgi:hypothetical protein
MLQQACRDSHSAVVTGEERRGTRLCLTAGGSRVATVKLLVRSALGFDPVLQSGVSRVAALKLLVRSAVG